MTFAAAARRRWTALFSGPPSPVVTLEVSSPNGGDEETWVFLTAAFVCLCVNYVLIFQLYDGTRLTRLNTAMPYQVLFRDLPGTEQRTFRQMQEGMTEALRLRATDGAWPSVESLAEQEIPPFAVDRLDKVGLHWRQRSEGLVTEYVGLPPAGADSPAYLMLIVAPEPGGGEQPVANVVDEEHQALPDGTLLHVTYWKRSPAEVPDGLVGDPAMRGWRQIRVSDPSQVVEAP